MLKLMIKQRVDKDSTMKGLFVFTVVVLMATVCVAFSLSVLDNIVHGTLYNYGLQFSYDWASPYWNALRAVQAFLVLTAVSTLVSAFYVYRKYIRVHAKPEVRRIEVKGEKLKPLPIPSAPSTPPVSSAPSFAMEPEPRASSSSGLVKCAHCNRVFAQPLRMLDFHSERPRIVNICPFCNEVIPPMLRPEESDRSKRIFLKGKRNNQSERKDEAKEAQKTEESVAASS
jgi:hypothetical protein